MIRLKSTAYPRHRWFLVSISTIFIVTILLIPGNNEILCDRSLTLFLNSFFTIPSSPWVIFELLVHVFMFAVLTSLWFWVAAVYYNQYKALILSVCIAISLSITTEIAQYFVSRGSQLLDVFANFIGIAVFVVILRQQENNSVL